MSHYELDYDVSINGSELLPPVTLSVSGSKAGPFRLQDYFTPDEAADLGARLTAMALKASPDEVTLDSTGERVRVRRIDNPPEDPSAEYALEDRDVTHATPDRHLNLANEPARSGHEPDSPNDWPEP